MCFFSALFSRRKTASPSSTSAANHPKARPVHNRVQALRVVEPWSDETVDGAKMLMDQ